MLFNSLEFALFLPIVFLLYWFVFNKSLRLQNFLILIASYVFYGWWDWRFLTLIIASSFVDFFIAKALDKQEQAPKRKSLLALSLIFNLGLLCIFKYFNFFVDSFAEAFGMVNQGESYSTLDIILPVGISFYTFQTLSYTIDVYRRKMKSTEDWVSFFAYVSFFPQLVAGPIERASHLLPQFHVSRKFEVEKAKDGLRQILWGIFKKVVIADTAALYVNDVWDNYQTLPASSIFLAGIMFSFQLYGDFSGYSDVAIGTSRLLGFDLKKNFNYPFFSRDVGEFHRRWHVSLASWFKDYLYIPLGGSKFGKWMSLRNVFIVFLVSGLWHGANWTYVLWGFVHACFFIPSFVLGSNRNHTGEISQGRILPTLSDALKIFRTFMVITIPMVIFRSETVSQALEFITKIFSRSLASIPPELPKKSIAFIVIMVVFEWLARNKEHGLELHKYSLPKIIRWGIYLFIAFLIFVFGGDAQAFIYFQF